VSRGSAIAFSRLELANLQTLNASSTDFLSSLAFQWNAGFIMSYLRKWFLLFLSSTFITSHVGAQETSPGEGQPSVEQLKLGIDELRQKIRDLSLPFPRNGRILPDRLI
jgi:hypothetical protein